MTSITPDSQFTQASTDKLYKKIIQFPLLRLILVMMIVVIETQLRLYLMQIDFLGAFKMPLITAIGIGLLILLYSLYARIVEKRKASEFSTKGMLSETGYGIALGFGIMAFLVFILYVAGYYRIDGFNDNIPYFVDYIFRFTLFAFIEELVFRLILFRLVEELLGTWISVLFQILLFGYAHNFNPNATLWSSMAIGIEAGILLSAVYIYTRRMWLALALHMAWNYTQGIIFGVRVSGIEGIGGVIEPVISGPAIITGGSFGLEASIISVFVCLLVSYYFIKVSILEKKIVPPMWKRKKITG